MDNARSAQRELIRIQILHLISTLELYLSDLVNQFESDQETGECYWSYQDVDNMLDYLLEHRRAERGEGCFKKHTFTAAAEYINHHSDFPGELKNRASVKSKFEEMKTTYNLINAWKAKSGGYYDNVNGANILRDTESAEVFDSWVAQEGHEEMEIYRNEGWGYYEIMLDILPEELPAGDDAYLTEPDSLSDASSHSGGEIDEEASSSTDPTSNKTGHSPSSASNQLLAPASNSMLPFVSSEPRGRKRSYSNYDFGISSPLGSPRASFSTSHPQTMASSVAPSTQGASKRSRT